MQMYRACSVKIGSPWWPWSMLRLAMNMLSCWENWVLPILTPVTLAVAVARKAAASCACGLWSRWVVTLAMDPDSVNHHKWCYTPCCTWKWHQLQRVQGPIPAMPMPMPKKSSLNGSQAPSSLAPGWWSKLPLKRYLYFCGRALGIGGKMW